MSVTIAGSNSTPSINGTYTVTVIDSTHFSIPVAVTTAGTAGTFTTTTPPPIPSSAGLPGAGPLVKVASTSPTPVPPVSKAVQAGEKNARSHAGQDVPQPLQLLRRHRSRLDHRRHAGHGPQHLVQLGRQLRVQLHVSTCTRRTATTTTIDAVGGSIWSGEDYY